MSIKRVFASILIFGGVAFAGTANAGAIFSATSATINSGGPGFGSINNTFNQNGLLTTYTSGVTDFDTYIAGNPMHTWVFSVNEWFSNQNSTSASVTYNFGAAKSFDRLALWNEDSNGIGALTLLTSNDGVNFANLATGLSPTNNLINANYGADVFSFGAVTAQYVRLDMSACPQPAGDGFNSCAIGEVAFRQVSAVPEPETNALMLAGLGVMGFVARRRKKQAA